MTSQPLYLMHSKPDARLLATWMARHRTRDLGEALHGLLRAAFGQHAPQPFRYLDERRGLLAYTSLDEPGTDAQIAKAEPLAAQALGLTDHSGNERYRLRAFPTQWPRDRMLGFEVRVRPTVRSGKQEQDAFLHAVKLAGGPQGAPVQRENVYVQWLHDRLNGPDASLRQPWQGAAEILDVRMNSFTRNKVMRRTQAVNGQPRRGHAIDGPDAVLSGRLRITDPDAFARLLMRGVGRHRAYGFGMLLLHSIH